MKRDWKRLQTVLEDVEADRLEARLDALDAGEEEDLYFGHLLLALDAGCINGMTVSRAGAKWCYSSGEVRLTMAGHDLLDAIRSKTVWAAVKAAAVDLKVPISMELIKTVALKLAGGA